MVCDGPDPTENNPNELIPPPRHELLMNGNHGEDSDEEQNEHFGYEPLPQGPDLVQSDHDDDDDDVENNDVPTPLQPDVPHIEPMDTVLTREIWSTPRNSNSIDMNIERVQQVMSAMANFALPQTSIPEWAQSISEDQWKQTLQDRIEKLRSNR